MFDLFQTEVQQHCACLADGLIALEQNASDPKMVEPLMRAAHSVKGAARIINLDGAIGLAHSMEECLVRIQKGAETPTASRIDELLRGSDILRSLADHKSEEEAKAWLESEAGPISALAEALNQPPKAGNSAPVASAPKIIKAPVASTPVASTPVASAPVASAPAASAPKIIKAPVASAPAASAPVASAPVASAPVASAPKIIKAPVASAPVASAPVASAPVASAPVASAPVASAPVASAPKIIKAPVASA
ncbi:MAG: Hpt domain-containing protein, partial [Planctomycetota bacterium]|nr:Hpt domain-containing protein [Planctomycetota bacterium]